MDTIKVKLITYSNRNGPHDRIEPLLRHLPQMERFGIVQVESDEDLILIDHIMLQKDPSIIDRTTKPIIIHEIADQASLVWHNLKYFLQMPKVLSLIKAVGLTPWYRYNDLALNYAQGWHFLKMYETDPDFLSPHGYAPMMPMPPVMTDREASKIDIGYSVFNNKHVEMVCRPGTTTVDMLKPRSIDVMYAAAVGFPDLTTTLHRNQGLAAVDGLENCTVHARGYWQECDNWTSRSWRHLFSMCGEEGKIYYKDLHLLMRGTKIFVSPWGTGEACFKDYEAMYAGCVLVKPDTSHCTTWPETYINNQTYVPCAHNFGDLQSVVDKILSHWDDYIHMRMKCRLMLLNARQEFARRYANIISKRFHSYRS